MMGGGGEENAWGVDEVIHTVVQPSKPSRGEAPWVASITACQNGHGQVLIHFPSLTN